MPIDDASYGMLLVLSPSLIATDKVYAIESTCHAPRREDVFAEIYRVLKPGGVFGVYEWVLTEKHDPANPAHVKAAKNIEIGNGLPSTSSYRVIPQALRECGFEVLDSEDFFSNRSGRK
jgi:sterol 24-C-methyltransferase